MNRFPIGPRTIAGLAVGSVVLFAVPRLFMSDMKTPGMKNIEDRFTAAGGSPTHTPSRPSKLGDSKDSANRDTQDKGVGSKYFQENYGDQAPKPTELGKKWNKTVHSGENGKVRGSRS